MTISKSEKVVVLDLDDTLYKEADYRQSGFRAVCREIEVLYGKSLARDLEEDRGDGDVLELLCQRAGLPLSVKESLLWIYRLHTPDIFLTEDVQHVLKQLEQKYPIIVLTDGRSVTQRKKILALGLQRLPVYISEDHCSAKPDSLRFEIIMKDYTAREYVYVADNPRKDFIAPNRLRWRTIGLRGDERNIHSQVCEGLVSEMLPNQWIDTLTELPDILC
ncbi:HAD family hydrolase [Ralstonia sp.]|uniref:HAD family hydrolase n=1 Tax=Ralstonia sp. TaxID=54061 RepID=UPI0031CECA8B